MSFITTKRNMSGKKNNSVLVNEFDLVCLRCCEKIENWIEDYCIECKRVNFSLKKSPNPFDEFDEFDTEPVVSMTIYKKIISCFGK